MGASKKNGKSGRPPPAPHLVFVPELAADQK
jgi:hypothetical protein